MSAERADLAEIRRFFAERMAAASRWSDPRFAAAVEATPREKFLGPGPWTVSYRGRHLVTPSADPAYLYQDGLVALDPAKGINNGEPFLHAAWIGAVAPQPGETVCHIGAGTGYYTAILARLVAPGGAVHAYEIEPGLAERARTNLAGLDSVTVHGSDATAAPLPACDIIYVNAGVAAPPLSWLDAARPGARLIFPWHPAEDVGLALLATRRSTGFAVRVLMSSWFIPCVGASDMRQHEKPPQRRKASSVRSLWRRRDRAPDDSAVAIYADVWFSCEELSAAVD